MVEKQAESINPIFMYINSFFYYIYVQSSLLL